MGKGSEVIVGDVAGQVYGGTSSLNFLLFYNLLIQFKHAAGADSTLSSVHTLFLAMVHYPEVQRKAQAELDRVLNHGRRLPGYEDQPDLPYITAVMKEILRWQPVAPFGELCTLIQVEGLCQ